MTDELFNLRVGRGRRRAYAASTVEGDRGGAISGGEERGQSVWVVGVGSAEDDGEMGVKGCIGEDWRNSVMSSCVDGGSVLQEYGGERLRIPSAAWHELLVLMGVLEVVVWECVIFPG